MVCFESEQTNHLQKRSTYSTKPATDRPESGTNKWKLAVGHDRSQDIYYVERDTLSSLATSRNDKATTILEYIYAVST